MPHNEDWARLSAGAGVATITLAAPAGPSRINVDSARAWLEAFRAADADPDVRVIVIRADGPVWSAGGDLAAMRELGGDAHDFIRAIGTEINALATSIHRSDKVSIAAVHGAVAGGGVGAMAACDMVVAEASTVITLGYAKLATNPDVGVTWFLPRQIGPRRALELYLTSAKIGAAEAREIGLVNRLADDGGLDEAVSELAAQVAALAPHATAAAKRLFRQSMDIPLEVQLDDEIRSFADNTRHPEFAEGVAAFLERRPPRFTQTGD